MCSNVLEGDDGAWKLAVARQRHDIESDGQFDSVTADEAASTAVLSPAPQPT